MLASSLGYLGYVDQAFTQVQRGVPSPKAQGIYRSLELGLSHRRASTCCGGKRRQPMPIVQQR